MQKVFNFIVDKKNIILILFILLSLFCLWLIPKVNINSDMTKYLPDDSSTKQGVNLMEKSFDDSNLETSSFYLMIEDLTPAEKSTIATELNDIKNVESIDYDINSKSYNKENYTLYKIHIDSPAESDEANSVVNTVESNYAENYGITMSGEAIGDSMLDVLDKIFVIALVILLVILFLMCNSWMEPVIFLITIAVAIFINMGTNVIFESVSEMIFAVAAVLQLVLSMDYSIMLLNRYRQEKQFTDDNKDAMKKALHNAFTAISSSSITTIVGMLALLFMSFTIGMDLGLVMAKGVFFSLLCIFTVLPGLILIFDKSIEKTSKKSLHFKMDKIASFSYKVRFASIAAFILLFVFSFFMRGNINISYTLDDYNEIERIFSPDNQILVLYQNSDEEAIASLSEQWETNAYINEVNGYSTTLGKELSYDEMADAMEMDEKLIAQMYYFYDNQMGNTLDTKMTLSEFIQFLSEDVASNEQFSHFFSKDDLAKLSMMPGAQTQEQRLSSDEFSALSGMDANIVEQIFGYYFMMYGQTIDSKIEMNSLIQFLMNDVATNEQFAPYFSPEAMQQLSMLAQPSQEQAVEPALSSAEIAKYLNIDTTMAEQLFNYYEISNGNMPENNISIYTFINFLADDVSKDAQFSEFFTSDSLVLLDDAKEQMNEGLVQLVGEEYSRIVLTPSVKSESAESFNIIENLQSELNSNLNSASYIIGNAAMAYEMSQTFPSELNYITILTIIAVFTVVLIAFRSLSVPIILVSLIQCAIFLTMGIASVQASSIYFLPLLIVQCLLLGATVDYGILYTSYYREFRETMDKKEAIKHALNSSIHTIMTSALILIAVTGIIGIMLTNSDPSISEILTIIAIGGICSSALVIFVLPGLLSALDRFTVKKTKKV